MKRLLFGIFAHPDDEAFGPSGTFYAATQDGAELHLISATAGDAGVNSDGLADLGEVRRDEWRQAGKLMGATSMECLSYQDGQLNNSLYLEIVDKLREHIKNTVALIDEPATIDLITFDTNGLSGHVDHIVMSLAATLTYLGLATELPSNIKVGKLKYFCLSEAAQPSHNIDWLYMPKGRPKKMIDETVDVSDFIDQKIAIMRTHYTQRADAESIINRMGDELKREHFYYYKD